MILVIDNYDSFTYNLVQYLGELGAQMQIFRNDAKSVDEFLALGPTHIIISPGPCTPKEAGVSLDLIKKTPENVPLLGVCLGHQSIGMAFGGKVIRAPYVMHGKIDEIKVLAPNSLLFKDIPQTFEATRYHSLIVERKSLPPDLEILAETKDGLIMALKHKTLPRYGLQFHPESILTKNGKQLLQNFLDI